MSEKAKTYDDGKAPLAVLPWAAIDELAMVQLYGHQKYKDFYNYRKGMEVSRNCSCAIRHIRDFMNGHDLDHESGRHALGHALTRIAFVLQNIADGTAIDDRYKGPTKTKTKNTKHGKVTPHRRPRPDNPVRLPRLRTGVVQAERPGRG